MRSSVRSDSVLKVSVCVVTYNQQNYIRRCLQSIVDQEVEYKFEVIVCDDVSTDGTREIIKEFVEKYPEIVKPTFHNKNIGALKNFVFAHQLAMGEYVAHVDGDDECLPGKLQQQADLLDDRPACTAIWHRVDYFNDQGEECSGFAADLSPFLGGRVSFHQAIRFGFVGVHSSLMYRKSARGPGPADSDMIDLFRTWDLLSKGDGYIIDRVLGRYRVGASGSITGSSVLKIRKLSIEHAKFFLSRFPECKKDFFVFFLIKCLEDVINMRATALDFTICCLRSFSFVSPIEIIDTLRQLRGIQVPWSKEKRLAGLSK